MSFKTVVVSHSLHLNSSLITNNKQQKLTTECQLSFGVERNYNIEQQSDKISETGTVPLFVSVQAACTMVLYVWQGPFTALQQKLCSMSLPTPGDLD